MKTIKIENQEVKIEMSIERNGGYGQYSISAEFEIYGEKSVKRFHSTDSQLFDEKEQTQEFEDRLFNIIENQLTEIIEEIIYFKNN